MKKSCLRYGFTLVLALCLAVVLLSVPAFADYYDTCLQGDDIGRETVYSSTARITAVGSNYGELAPGLTLSKDNYNIYLSGSPSQSGTYECELWIDTEDGRETCVISLWIKERGATPTPTPVHDPRALPYITKNPTGETVDVGGSATFIARADNATQIIWRLVSPDTTNTIEVQNASGYFPGLSVSGQGSEKLVLSNIPKELNKWCAECRFVNSAGSSFTNGAIITVRTAGGSTQGNNTAGSNEGTGTNNTNKPSSVKTPIINTQPRGANQVLGNSCTLTVKAISPDGAELSYQWYVADESDPTKLTPISNENNSTFTPPQTEGTAHYCVAISGAKNGEYSETVYSSLAAVTYSQPASVPASEPTADPAAAAQPQPEQGTEETVLTDGVEDVVVDRYESGGLSASVIFFALTGVLALAALVFILIYLKRSADREDEFAEYDRDLYSRPTGSGGAQKYSHDAAGEEAMKNIRKSQIMNSTKKPAAERSKRN